MSIVSDILIALVAILHIGFMVIESFLWQTPFAMKRFQMSGDKAKTTAVLAYNQGFYNLFLSAGLIFMQFYRGSEFYQPGVFFFLGCVIVAGIVGAATVSRRIFAIQAMPAILAAIALGLH